MTDHPLVHEQTPVEYFKELVESSLSRQRVRAGDLTEFYLVNLLCQYVRLDATATRPTTASRWRFVWRGRSTAAARTARPPAQLGDFSLFMSGFFSDSFARRSVDVDYYRSLGECAYALAEPIGGRGVRRSLRRAVAEVRRIHGCPRRHQRPHGAWPRRPTSAHLREVAAHRQRAGRPAARRARHPSESLDRPPIHPIGSVESGPARPLRGVAQLFDTLPSIFATPRVYS